MTNKKARILIHDVEVVGAKRHGISIDGNVDAEISAARAIGNGGDAFRATNGGIINATNSEAIGNAGHAYNADGGTINLGTRSAPISQKSWCDTWWGKVITGVLTQVIGGSILRR